MEVSKKYKANTTENIPIGETAAEGVYVAFYRNKWRPLLKDEAGATYISLPDAIVYVQVIPIDQAITN